MPNCDLCGKIAKKRTDLGHTVKNLRLPQNMRSVALEHWKQWNTKFQAMGCADCYNITKKAVEGAKSHGLSRTRIDSDEECQNCDNAVRLLSDIKKKGWDRNVEFTSASARQKWKKAQKNCEDCYHKCGGSEGLSSCKNYEIAGNAILNYLVDTL